MPVLSFSEIMQLGLTAHRAGRWAEAEYYYRQLQVHQPNDHRLLHLLGLVLHQTGRHPEALPLIEQALELAPQEPEYFNSRGEIHRALNHRMEARRDYERALELRPNYAEAMTNLGSFHQLENRLSEAESLHYRAHELNPDSAVILNNLGTVLDRTQRRSEAWKCFRKALEKNPRYLKPRLNLIASLLSLHRGQEAIEEVEKAIPLFPQSRDLWLWQARALKESDRTVEAIRVVELYREDFQDQQVEALTFLASCYHGVGDLDTSLKIYDEILALKPDTLLVAYTRLTLLNYSCGENGPRLFQEHRNYIERFHPHEGLPRPKSPRGKAGGPLRLGYISNDFKNHSVSRFILPIIEKHDSSRFEVHCFALNESEDVTTHRYQRACPHWHKAWTQSDDELEREILQLDIDLLVDLGGLFGGRLGLLARQVAPVQVCYLGYPNTCGLKNVQYRITDAVADPPGTTEQFHTEKLWRLPGSAWCYQPLDAQVDVEPLPADRFGHVTFGCFHGIHKYRPIILEAWANILAQVPDSLLIIKSFKGLGHSETRSRFRAYFEKVGVDLNRIKFAPSSMCEEEHLQLFNQIDLALDTFPYNGTTVTCEALWMGVPSITLAGPTHVTRVGASLVTHGGIPEAVTSSVEEYIQRAVELATNRPRLREIRQRLRSEMQSSSLGNPELYTRQLEEAFLSMWASA